VCEAIACTPDPVLKGNQHLKQASLLREAVLQRSTITPFKQPTNRITRQDMGTPSGFSFNTKSGLKLFATGFLGATLISVALASVLLQWLLHGVQPACM